MAFPNEWSRRCALVIQASEVVTTCSEFSVLVTEDTLPSEIFDADGSYPAISGGGDIRFSSDEVGETRLACEIEQFVTDNDPANGKASIWVNVPSVSSSVDTTIYIWYNKAGESQPAEDAAFGSEATWKSSYKMVQHMDQDPSGSSPQMIDSTSNDNDGISYGTMLTEDLVEGKVGDCLEFDGDDDALGGSVTGLTSHVNTVSCWIYPHTGGEDNQGRIVHLKPVSGWNAFFFERELAYCIRVGISDGINSIVKVGTANDITQNAWNHVAYTYDGGAGSDYVKIYVNGSEVSYTTETGNNVVSAAPATYTIGANVVEGVYAFDGLIDEVKVSNIAHTAGWIETEYNNQNSPSTFIIEGTPESPVVGWVGIFNGISSTNIAKISGIPIANIAKVNGVASS